ncbi:MAG: DUF1648 domain-containing protein [Chloroflexota bacterium]|nr:DUF1648 domain-containing protein [Chloroflexota bacterium]MDQ5867802.1 DUF1648 domain-containing protein [Chloroflexota bacterium]
MNTWRAQPVPARLLLVVLSQLPVVLAGWLWFRLSERVSLVEYDGGVFLLGLAFSLSLFLYGMTCYLAYCAFSISYSLDRDFLTMRCGPSLVRVPVAGIQAVHGAGEAPAGAVTVRWKGAVGMVPGYVVGEGRSPQFGRVFSMATVPASRQVWVVTRGMAYGLSPEYPDRFAQLLTARLEDEDTPPGPASTSRVRRSRVLDMGRGLWADRVVRALFLAGLALNVLLWGYLSLVYADLPSQVAMHWNAQAQVDRIGDPVELLDLPLFALGVWLFNSIAARVVLRRERAATIFLLAGAVAAQVFFFAGALSIVLKN